MNGLGNSCMTDAEAVPLFRVAPRKRGCRFRPARKPRTRTKSDTGTRMTIRPFCLWTAPHTGRPRRAPAESH